MPWLMLVVSHSSNPRGQGALSRLSGCSAWPGGGGGSGRRPFPSSRSSRPLPAGGRRRRNRCCCCCAVDAGHGGAPMPVGRDGGWPCAWGVLRRGAPVRSLSVLIDLIDCRLLTHRSRAGCWRPTRRPLLPQPIHSPLLCLCADVRWTGDMDGWSRSPSSDHGTGRHVAHRAPRSGQTKGLFKTHGSREPRIRTHTTSSEQEVWYESPPARSVDTGLVLGPWPSGVGACSTPLGVGWIGENGRHERRRTWRPCTLSPLMEGRQGPAQQPSDHALIHRNGFRQPVAGHRAPPPDGPSKRHQRAAYRGRGWPRRSMISEPLEPLARASDRSTQWTGGSID